MGIITEEVKVAVTSNTVKYYENLGYTIPKKKASAEYQRKKKKEFVYDLNSFITVKVQDLPKNSHVTVDVLCDECCETIYSMSYQNYRKEIEKFGNCVCSKCRSSHQQITFLKKYGVKNPMQYEEFKGKQNKALQINYGVDSPLKNKEILERAQETTYKKFGVLYASQNEEIKQKIASTMTERYGVPYSSQSPELREKAKQTWIQNLGVDNPNKNPKVKEKLAKTFYKNGTQKASKQQRYLCFLYNGVLNFPISYYSADIAFPEEMLTIEYDGGFHKGNVITNRETEEEFNRKEIIRNKIIKCNGFKQMRIISSKDLLPSDIILLQMLGQTRQYFNTYPNHSWIEYNIDSSTVRNAEHKEGVFFNFGELRRIKDSDLVA